MCSIFAAGRGDTHRFTVDKKLRHPLESHRSIGDTLKISAVTECRADPAAS